MNNFFPSPLGAPGGGVRGGNLNGKFKTFGFFFCPQQISRTVDRDYRYRTQKFPELELENQILRLVFSSLSPVHMNIKKQYYMCIYIRGYRGYRGYIVYTSIICIYIRQTSVNNITPDTSHKGLIDVGRREFYYI